MRNFQRTTGASSFRPRALEIKPYEDTMDENSCAARPTTAKVRSAICGSRGQWPGYFCAFVVHPIAVLCQLFGIWDSECHGSLGTIRLVLRKWRAHSRTKIIAQLQFSV